MKALEGTGRVHIMYCAEEMKEDLGREVDRLAKFLGIPLTEKKRAAVVAASFDGMKSREGSEKTEVMQKMLMRKGQVGVWKNYMTEADWKRVDDAFEERVGTLALAQPLRKYHAY